MTTEAHPFVKWVGGKTQLLDTIVGLFPTKVRTFYEPFVGGGALFYHLANAGRFERAAINDWNTELVGAYRCIRDFPSPLIQRLYAYKELYLADPEKFYYFVRDEEEVPEQDPVHQAARFLFLNRTCFNGLYRVNKKGKFNSPWGKYKNPKICNEPLLRACSAVLERGVTITQGDFYEAVKDAQEGDVVYFDPPYVPINATSNFTSYTRDGFTLNDQHRLAVCFKELADRGVAVLASNSDTEVVRELYKNFEMHQVLMRRNVNSAGDKRGPIGELLIVGRRGGLVPPQT